MKIMNNKRASFFGVKLLCFLLVACGGGGSDSNSSENAISMNDAAALVGVYQGSEVVRLIRISDNTTTDSNRNEVTITIDRSGRLSLSTSGRNQGQAQITNARTFSLRADARTQFDGACSAGTISINGSVTPETVTASYLSEGLMCNSQGFRLEGEISSKR